MKGIKETHAVEEDSGLNGGSDQRKGYTSGLRDREKLFGGVIGGQVDRMC